MVIYEQEFNTSIIDQEYIKNIIYNSGIEGIAIINNDFDGPHIPGTFKVREYNFDVIIKRKGHPYYYKFTKNRDHSKDVEKMDAVKLNINYNNLNKKFNLKLNVFGLFTFLFALITSLLMVFLLVFQVKTDIINFTFIVFYSLFLSFFMLPLFLFVILLFRIIQEIYMLFHIINKVKEAVQRN